MCVGLGEWHFIPAPDIFGGQIMYKKGKQEKTRKNIIFPKVPGLNQKWRPSARYGQTNLFSIVDNSKILFFFFH